MRSSPMDELTIEITVARSGRHLERQECCQKDGDGRNNGAG